MPGIGPHDGFKLRVYGAHIQQAFGHTPYQVGSSLAIKGEKNWRDVDVRLLLPDDEFAAYFGDPMKVGWDAPKLGMWNYAWTALGKDLTRLPIDFQFQSIALANSQFSQPEGHPRSALVLLDTDLSFIRTGKLDDLEAA